MTIKVFGLHKFTGGKGGAVAFFDIMIDNAFVIKGNTLFESNRTQGTYYWKGKSFPRYKGGAVVKDEDGNTIYDNIIRPTFKDKDTKDKAKYTDEANAFLDAVTEQAVEAYENAGESTAGRGAPKAAAPTKAKPAARKPAAAAARTEDAESSTSEDDELPFN